jgi:hypothetical protein
MKHVHADLIKQWADDTSIEIQMRIKHSNTSWANAYRPLWDSEREYRIKPKLIRVGRHEWPEPLKEVIGGVMYTVNLVTREINELYTLKPSTMAVAAGVAHATREAAEQHRDALICISKGDIE